MKTDKEIQEMAEREYPTENIPQDQSFYENSIMQDAFIKCYKNCQEEDKWIKCSERLPDEDGQYLVYDELEYQTIGMYYKIPRDEYMNTEEQNKNSTWNHYYSNWHEEGTGHGGCNSLINPTHWQPLPSEPKN